MAKLLLLHGPNLNLLGKREPALYGNRGLADIDRRLATLAGERGHELTCFQSNAEHELVERIQMAGEQDIDFVIINPAAFTHTSIAIRDAFLAVAIPFIEVHLSNVHRREPFRHHSYLSDIAVGVIAGLGPLGYELALGAAMAHVTGDDFFHSGRGPENMPERMLTSQETVLPRHAG
uniref:3-dehydroquinate dehydratase n=1 Tax=Candidatus Kentrum sp. DK TaxID=2126562 RepID=A0A450RUG2_9GAMM|nr:MAG: 3-dehydroquinate dehydratase [Candidatus Kentron sp. DK]